MGPPTSGTYVLIISIREAVALQVGRLGVREFRSGYYLYVGRARRGLPARLARHQRKEKRIHWHVDYLLAAGQIEGIWAAPGPAQQECAWAAALQRLPDASLAVPGFGSSDCRCPGHLVVLPHRPDEADMLCLLPRAERLDRQT